MTIILTCLTNNFIVQASDRRFSYPDNSRPPEDDKNKALIYSNCFAFAFTGRARLSGKSTIDWAAERLSEKDNIGTAVIHLKNRATDLMNNFYSSDRAERKLLAFVGAGFADIEENGRISRKALRIVISNFRGEKNTWLERAHKEFKVDYDWLPKYSKFELYNAGQALPNGRQNKLNNIIKWCLRQNKGPETIGRFLAREIQAMNNPTVGKNIMCTFVPRAFKNNNDVRKHFGAILSENPITSTEQQILKPVEIISIHDRFALPPPFDNPRFVYISGDSHALPYLSPVHVVPGQIIPEITISDMSITIPPVIQIPNPETNTPQI